MEPRIIHPHAAVRENGIVLPDEISKLIEDLPESQQETFKAVLAGIFTWQGPLPHPAWLSEYNANIANGAERLFIEIQRQVRHRMELENRVIPEQQRQSSRGQLYGLLVALSFLATSALLIVTGHGVYGTILGTVDLVALVTVFVAGRNNHSRPKKE